MMTSLDMRGISISIYPADDRELDLLKSATSLSAWPGVCAITPINIQLLTDGLTAIAPLASKHEETEAFPRHCCEVMIACEDALNAFLPLSGSGLRDRGLDSDLHDIGTYPGRVIVEGTFVDVPGHRLDE